MKNKAIKYLLLTIMIGVCSGCTHNNGDIGPLFGKWKLTEISIDGNIDNGYGGNIFWSFQSSTVNMIKVSEHHQTKATYGSWTQTDDILTISFPDEDFSPMEELNLKTVNDFNIIKLSGSQMTLRSVDNDDATTEYKFQKW